MGIQKRLAISIMGLLFLKTVYGNTNPLGKCRNILANSEPTQEASETQSSTPVSPAILRAKIRDTRNRIEDIMNAINNDKHLYKIMPHFDETQVPQPESKEGKMEIEKIKEQKAELKKLFRELHDQEMEYALKSPEEAKEFLAKNKVEVEIRKSEHEDQPDRAFIDLSKLDEDVKSARQRGKSHSEIFSETMFGKDLKSLGHWNPFDFRENNLRSLDLIKFVKEMEMDFAQEDALKLVERSVSRSHRNIAHSQTIQELKKADLSSEEGQKFKTNLALFEKPLEALGENRKTGEILPDAQLTPQERSRLAEAAYKILTKNGNTSNANHLGDHMALLNDPKVAADLQKASISTEDAKLLVLLHDLGKEYDQMPQGYRESIEKIFPKPSEGTPDKHFLNRNIMAHEFGSMAKIDELSEQLNISPAKRDRLKALIAGHNAGYDKLGEGSHFWQTMWPKFAKDMNDAGASVPSEYKALKNTLEGQNPLTIVLTAADRATSKTLASQEKFADTLVKNNTWSNEALAQQILSSRKNVGSEVENVLSKLEAHNGKDYDGVKDVVRDFFKPADQNLVSLSEKLPQMASGTGAYKDRPTLSEAELKSSVVYCQEKTSPKGNERTWYKIAQNGKVFRFQKKLFGSKWVEASEFTPPTGPASPTSILFREFIFKDYNYTPQALKRESF